MSLTELSQNNRNAENTRRTLKWHLRHLIQLISLISPDTMDITVASISRQCNHTKTFTEYYCIFALGNKDGNACNICGAQAHCSFRVVSALDSWTVLVWTILLLLLEWQTI